ncbi:hypothetical protein [uncultured Microbacterium sp.]|uniref:hypothetical protein n=1 Tax=uncultured Microbacterium sp. TaxID=191216 RepID=UPI0028D10388|nr:hypothetical protein [uncultured Microbacterium sp.]
MASGFDGIMANITARASELAHEKAAEHVARIARERSLASADGIKIDANTDASALSLDVERVRSRANEILRSDV